MGLENLLNGYQRMVADKKQNGEMEMVNNNIHTYILINSIYLLFIILLYFIYYVFIRKI